MKNDFMSETVFWIFGDVYKTALVRPSFKPVTDKTETDSPSQPNPPASGPRGNTISTRPTYLEF